MDVLGSLRLGSRSPESELEEQASFTQDLPELETIVLNGFDLRTGIQTWDAFRNALSKWNRPWMALELNGSRNLTDEIVSELVEMVGILRVDGIEKGKALAV